MVRSRLILLPLLATLAACTPSNLVNLVLPNASASTPPLPGASTAPTAAGNNYFKVNGEPAPLSGKATLTSFGQNGLIGNYGLAPLTIPEKYLLTVEVQLKDGAGARSTFGTADVTKAEAKLGVNGTAWKTGAIWTPEKPDGITFELSVKDRKVTMKWVGSVKAADDTPYQIDALMTDVAVPFK